MNNSKIKKLSIQLNNAVALGNLYYDDAFEAEEFDEYAAAEWEKISNEEQRIREELTAEIVKFSLGQIDSNTAWKMTFKPELHDLIKRLA